MTHSQSAGVLGFPETSGDMGAASGPGKLHLATPQGPELEAAVLDTHSPARGVLKELEADRLAHLPGTPHIDFVKGPSQGAGEGAV